MGCGEGEQLPRATAGLEVEGRSNLRLPDWRQCVLLWATQPFIVGALNWLSGMHLFRSLWLPERKVRKGEVIRMQLLPKQPSSSNILAAARAFHIMPTGQCLSTPQKLLGLLLVLGILAHFYFSSPMYPYSLLSTPEDASAMLASFCLFLPSTFHPPLQSHYSTPPLPRSFFPAAPFV